jgi:glycine cleavage system aminomethyltransferase T
MMTGELKAVLSHPAYSGVTYQDRVGGSTSFRSWEFNGWPQESLSWKQGCCLHAGLSGSGPLSIKGPGAKKYLESICINSFDNFPVGSMKHAVMCNEDGIIEAHGIIERLAEDHFTSYAGGPPSFDLSKVPPNVTSERLRWYLFQIAGPSSAALIEKLTGENLHDLKFLCQRNSKVLGKYLESGKDIQVEIARIGMARNLAYEFHGPMEEAAEVYDAVFKVGQEFGIERFGWNTYWVNHTEGGFPQISGHFTSPLQAKALPSLGGTSGSVDPQNMRARYRTPVEVGWGHLAKPHDYPGRKAVEAELANPKRTTVTLRWNAKDVGAVWNTWLKPGEEALPLLTMPHGPYRKNRGGHQDHILLNGREIGYSSGVIYSYYFREFLSFGCIDIEAAALGTEMSVLWGDYGRRMLGIRATVAELPYLSKGKFGQPDPQ